MAITKHTLCESARCGTRHDDLVQCCAITRIAYNCGAKDILSAGRIRLQLTFSRRAKVRVETIDPLVAHL